MPKRQHKEFYEVSKEEVKYMNSTNNNGQRNDHFTLERDHNKSATFNYEYRFDSVACDAFGDFRTDRIVGVNRVKSPIVIEQHAYENWKFDLNLNKKLLLHKFFRSTEQNYAVYENLCRGCGYGVFEARGQLCHFCECIVQGVEARRSVATAAAADDTSANIYENICDKCSAIYSSDECECCSANERTNSRVTAVTDSECNDKNKDSDKEVSATNEIIEPPVTVVVEKLNKSKSFNKRDKRSIFHGLLGSLKRVKSPQTLSASASASASASTSTPATPSPGTRKRLEIVHNVDGFENVFRTQETFDLQRICELKRTQTSCSDQHIYGRLKLKGTPEEQSEEEHSARTLPLQLSQSHDQLLQVTSSVEGLISASSLKEKQHSKKTGNALGKRPRISRPRLLLRSRSQNTSASNTTLESEQQQSQTQTPPTKQSLYLADSVCHWMTSLRREIHNYRSYGFNIDDDNIALCSPKSIPAKNTPIYCASYSFGGVGGVSVGVCEAPSTLVTNCQNIEASTAVKFYNIPAHRISDVSSDSSYSNNSSFNCDETVTLRRCVNNRYTQCDSREQQQLQKSPVAQMVHDFKRSLLAKQMHEQQRNDSAAASARTTPPELSASVAQHRSKRQAIYLKIDDENSNKYNNNNNTHSEHEENNSYDPNVNYARKQTSKTTSQLGEAMTTAAPAPASQQHTALADAQGLASRRAARQAITTSSKRCGIYERDSEFVNDILSAFDTFLQREIETPDALDESDKTTKTTEVISGGDLNCNAESDVCLVTAQPTAADQCNGRATETTDVIQGNDSQCAEATISSDPQPTSTSTSAETVTEVATLPLSVISGPRHTLTCGGSCLTLVQPFVAASAKFAIEQTFDLVRLIEHLLLSRSLNSIVICYDNSLRVFLRNIYNRCGYRVKYAQWSQQRLFEKYQRFHIYCERSLATERSLKLTLDKVTPKNLEYTHDSVFQVLRSDRVSVDNQAAERNSVKIVVKLVQSCQDQTVTAAEVSSECVKEDFVMKSEVFKNSESGAAKDRQSSDNSQVANSANSEIIRAEAEACSSEHSRSEANKNTSVSPKNINRPQVPARDPKTTLTSVNVSSTATTTTTKPTLIPTNSDSPPLPAKRESPPKINRTVNKMTVPTANSKPTQTTCNFNNNNTNNNNNIKPNHNSVRRANKDDEAEDEEEPIYQPIWKFKTVGEVQERYHTDADYYEIGSTTTAATKSLLADDSSLQPVSLLSHDVDDHGEWETDDEFMFQTQMECDAATAAPDAYSLNSSTVRSTRSNSSATGSTVTGFGSSTATLASAISTSLTHHLFRNIGIFYSLTEPKLRAIIFDYDRVHSSAYFAKQPQSLSVMDSSVGSHGCNANDSGIGKSPEERSPIPPPRTTSAKGNHSHPGGESGCQLAAVAAAAVAAKVTASARQPPLLPDSVQAWKFLILDVNYLEDEEDMIVSETEILRAQEIKEDTDTRPIQQLQRFKSASFGNLIDLPSEDKKSITERVRNKLQRGVFKLNVRSPKSEKKTQSKFRRAEAHSLYLEDGMKPKYPIFGAPLEQLELNRTSQPNVPRFVVDCVEYIERKDCIHQDGLYRASGNKVSIDELKQKLSESYIYDPKLLVIDDLHTLTSLLKMFFRELGAPLIAQETYERLGRNLTDAAGIETLRLVLDEMREPNRSTLKFLIQHLTNVAACSSENRMPASNLAIVWGPCLLSVEQIQYDIGRANTLAKVLIENYDRIFIDENERLVC